LHSKSNIILKQALSENNFLYNQFFLFEQTKIPVWSFGKSISEWYILEYFLYFYFKSVETENKNKNIKFYNKGNNIYIKG